MAKITAIANQKGGVGKTTTAVNLSAYLSHRDKKVLLIDIDAQGNTCSSLGLNKHSNDPGIYEVLMGKYPMEAVIQETNIPNLSIVPVNIHLVGAQVELIEKNERESCLKYVLESIKDEYDFIFIDCPPSLGLMTVNALVAAHSVLIPLQCEFFALEGLAQLIKTIRLLQRGLNPILSIEGILMTMYDNRTNLSLQVVKEATEYFRDKVYKTIIPRNVKLAEAPSYGLTVLQYDPNCVGAKSYKKLAEEFLSKKK